MVSPQIPLYLYSHHHSLCLIYHYPCCTFLNLHITCTYHGLGWGAVTQTRTSQTGTNDRNNELCKANQHKAHIDTNKCCLEKNKYKTNYISDHTPKNLGWGRGRQCCSRVRLKSDRVQL